MATGPEHYKRAEELLAEITRDDGSVDFGDGGEAYVAAAQVHATLALAAATALEPSETGAPQYADYQEWRSAASTNPARTDEDDEPTAPNDAPAGYRYVPSVFEGAWELERILPD